MTKFTTVGLSSAYTHSRNDPSPWEEKTAWGVTRLPGGEQRFWGVPFSAGGSDPDAPGLVVIGAAGSTEAVRAPIDGAVSFVIFAHLCDSRASTTVAGQTADYPNPVVTAPGEHLADYVLEFADGGEHRVAVRRRFEVNQVMTRMQSGFVCRPHQGLTPLPMRGPYPADMWGRYQTGASVGPTGPPPPPRQDLRGRTHPAPSWSIYALPNPEPGRQLRALRFEPTGAAAVGIGAITLFDGAHHPLRHERLESVRVALPPAADRIAAGESAEIDLGVVARRYDARAVEADAWLGAAVKGRGEVPDEPELSLVLDVAGSGDATLSVLGQEISLGEVLERGTAGSADGQVRIELLTPRRVWVTCKVVDAVTGQPTPARVHFRAPDGRYFPPYGHRHEVNDNWFEDYGADVKLGDTPYAYVDGSFRAELPVGDLFVEASKGFEYEPLRARLNIEPGQSELTVELQRGANLRTQGWITADTHVHFISPDTARLEAQAEGLNVVNLLAAQWGDLFTNVGDITGALAGASHDDCVVWVGTENRQHFLGHISMLGVQGEPVFPMSTSGPTEGYFGDTTVRAMSEWADECRRKGGLVVVPHFPYPHSEIIAEIVRGRVDGVEFWDFWTPTMDSFSFHELYRLLNCGYRVAVVGGTDKMSAGMPVGNVRTYAYTGDDELTFEAWARAVRAGRTYTTSGPLVRFSVEGRQPGDELTLPAGGGAVHVEAEVTSLTGPVNRLEIVLNGRVVAQEVSAAGTRSLKLSESVQVAGSGWLAARCVSESKAWSVWPQHIAAHTSAVYLKAGRDEVFDNPTAEYLVTTMEGGIAWLDTLATRDSPERHAAVRRVFEEAIAQVRSKIR
ncbi:MAG: CehA/McbA family metallohydrolase [Chloroflexota bacterium]